MPLHLSQFTRTRLHLPYSGPRRDVLPDSDQLSVALSMGAPLCHWVLPASALGASWVPANSGNCSLPSSMAPSLLSALQPLSVGCATMKWGARLSRDWRSGGGWMQDRTARQYGRPACESPLSGFFRALPKLQGGALAPQKACDPSEPG